MPEQRWLSVRCQRGLHRYEINSYYNQKKTKISSHTNIIFCFMLITGTINKTNIEDKIRIF